MSSHLKLTHISFSINHQSILRNIDLEVAQGDFLVLVGANGSGKSTLLKVINGHYVATHGSICLKGKRLENYKQSELSRTIVTLNQFVCDSLFIDLTVAENMRLIAAAHKIPHQIMVENFLQLLNQFNPALKQVLNRKVKDFSGGEQQVLAFALYLQLQPQLLLLDEHTSALDPKTAYKIMQFTRQVLIKRRLTAIMTTHRLEDALECGNRLIAMADGTIVYQALTQDKRSLNRQKLLEFCY